MKIKKCFHAKMSQKASMLSAFLYTMLILRDFLRVIHLSQGAANQVHFVGRKQNL